MRGTKGADLHPEAAALMREGDLCLEKHYYSSFTETILDPLLKRMGVGKLIICGVTTNNCVNATVRDAFHLGYDVFLPSDGTAHVNPKKEADTIDQLAPYCFSVLPPGDPVDGLFLTDTTTTILSQQEKLVWDGTERLSGLGAGDSLLLPNFLSSAEADEILQNLLSEKECEVQWNTLQHATHGSTLPRLTAYESSQNECGHLPAYRCADPQPWHGQYETMPWSKRVDRVRHLIAKRAKHTFNWSRILCYRDGNDGMGFHSDKCKFHCQTHSLAIEPVTNPFTNPFTFDRP